MSDIKKSSVMLQEKVSSMALVLIIIITIVSSIGCTKKNIEGETKDPFGKGISGVSVQILKSQFKETTDGSGKYSIDYVPGTFTIQYSKDGYTTHKLDLTIQQKSKFPAEPIIMYPIPKEKGFHYIGSSGLIQLYTVPVIENTQRETNWRRIYSIALKAPSGKSVITIGAGKSTFIDTFPQRAALVNLGNGELIQDFSEVFLSLQYNYNGFQKDSTQRVGEEKLLLRTVDLQPGNYAWCGVVEMLMIGGARPDKELPCFPFDVIEKK